MELLKKEIKDTEYTIKINRNELIDIYLLMKKGIIEINKQENEQYFDFYSEPIPLKDYFTSNIFDQIENLLE